MVVGPPAERPVILAVAFLDRQIIDAGDPKPHQPLVVELPVLVAVTSKPAAAVVVPFIGEAHRNAVVVEGPYFLDEPVIEFAVPFTPQERLDGFAPLQEFRAVTPAAVGGVGERHFGGIAAVPCVLRHPRLLRGGFGAKRRKRRAAHGLAPLTDYCR